jgi:2-polyprenyl-3-methyl-5-hydroxy-6-metoxy-1,4-benzoquinol methylase
MTIDIAEVAAVWNKNAFLWSEFVGSGKDSYRDHFTFPAFAGFLPELKGLEIVDFGCGEGTNTRRFSAMGARMVGVDLSSELLSRARSAEQSVPLGIRYVQASYTENTGLASESFDGVVSTMAFMDGPDVDAAMREVYRLLKPGGFMAFNVIHPCFMNRMPTWGRSSTGEITALCVSRYFDRTPFIESMRPISTGGSADSNRIEIPRFPRTISDYLNAVARSGLVLKAVDEPMPDEEMCRAIPRLKLWREHGAFVLQVLARRPD